MAKEDHEDALCSKKYLYEHWISRLSLGRGNVYNHGRFTTGGLNMETVQVRVYIYGVVQGVGFRHSLSMVARKNDLRGWVRNRPDGSVEALLQGERTKLEKMLEWCQKGSPFSSVEKVHVLWEDKDIMPDTFTILF